MTLAYTTIVQTEGIGQSWFFFFMFAFAFFSGLVGI